MLWPPYIRIRTISKSVITAEHCSIYSILKESMKLKENNINNDTITPEKKAMELENYRSPQTKRSVKG